MVVKRFLDLTIWVKENKTWLLLLSTQIFRKGNLQLLLLCMSILYQWLIIFISRDSCPRYNLCSLYHLGTL
ncbi:hypothetical protein LINGRAPRIM_LOCUS2266 [Linum grandiflorum]